MTRYTKRWFAWFRRGVTTRLDHIEQTLQTLKANDAAHSSDMAQLKTQGIQLMSAMDNLTAAVARLQADDAQMFDMFDHLAQANRDLAAQLAAANTSQDPAIQAVADQLGALADAAEARVAANAPAPAPVAEPAPEPAPADPVPAAPDAPSP